MTKRDDKRQRTGPVLSRQRFGLFVELADPAGGGEISHVHN